MFEQTTKCKFIALLIFAISFVLTPQCRAIHNESQTGELWGYIDCHGKLVIEPKFEQATKFSENYAAVEEKGKWGFINHSGHWTIKPQFAWVAPFRQGRACARKEDASMAGYLGTKDSWAIKPQFVFADDFSEGLASVWFGTEGYTLKDEDWQWSGLRDAYIDVTGKKILQIGKPIGTASPFSEGVAEVSNNVNLAGAPAIHFINKQGHSVSQRPTHEGVAVGGDGRLIDDNGSLTDEAGPCLINKNGKRLSENHKWIGEAREGMVLFLDDIKYGFLNTSGSVAIQAKFDCAWSFSNGLACVVTNGKLGYIGLDGNFVIKPQFAFHTEDKAAAIQSCPFPDRAKAKNVKQVFWAEGIYNGFDCNNRLPIEILPEQSYQFDGGLAPVLVGKRWGFINKKGRIVIKPTFRKVGAFSEGLAAVCVKEGSAKAVGLEPSQIRNSAP